MFVDIRDFTPRSRRRTPPRTRSPGSTRCSRSLCLLSSRPAGTSTSSSATEPWRSSAPQRSRRARRCGGGGRALLIQRQVTERFAGELRIGIGINTGKVIAGTIGGGTHLEFTLIGDTTNVAARVEQLTKTTGDAILSPSRPSTAWCPDPPDCKTGTARRERQGGAGAGLRPGRRATQPRPATLRQTPHAPISVGRNPGPMNTIQNPAYRRRRGRIEHPDPAVRPDESVTGFGVMGLPSPAATLSRVSWIFPGSPRSGPVRPGTGRWYRDPAGAWTFYATSPAEESCARYFSVANPAVVCPIDMTWHGDFGTEHQDPLKPSRGQSNCATRPLPGCSPGWAPKLPDSSR